MINPQNPLQPTPPDALWAQSASQWAINIVMLFVIGVFWIVIARIRLASIGPRKRKHGSTPSGATPPSGV